MDVKSSNRQRILQLLASRKRPPGDAFGYGITTADRYLRPVIEHNPEEKSLALLGLNGSTTEQALKEAAEKTVYCNEDLVTEECASSVGSFKSLLKAGSDIEIPKKTLLVFRNIVTTSRKDRDRDILVTSGARVDPVLPLLAFHNHMMHIGKMLEVIDHTKDLLRVVSVLLDINVLTHDIAILIEAKALRISHGFSIDEAEEMKPDDGERWTGLRITGFEIMEHSTVPVPSNVEAVIEQFSKGALKSPQMRYLGKTWSDARPAFVKSGVTIDPDGKVTVNVERPVTEHQEKMFSQGYFPSVLLEAQRNSGDGGGAKEPAKGQGVRAKEGHAAGLTRDKLFARIEGSWEWTEDQLRRSLKEHLKTLGLAPPQGEHWWAYIEATFADNAIVSVERMSGDDQFYRIDWKLFDGQPKWQGGADEVEVTAVVKRSRTSDKLGGAILALDELGKTLGEDKADVIASAIGIVSVARIELAESRKQHEPLTPARAAAALFASPPDAKLMGRVQEASAAVVESLKRQKEMEALGLSAEELELIG